MKNLALTIGLLTISAGAAFAASPMSLSSERLAGIEQTSTTVLEPVVLASNGDDAGDDNGGGSEHSGEDGSGLDDGSGHDEILLPTTTRGGSDDGADHDGGDD